MRAGLADAFGFRATPGRALAALLGVVALLGCTPPTPTHPSAAPGTATEAGPTNPSATGLGGVDQVALGRFLANLTSAVRDDQAWQGLLDHSDPTFEATAVWLRENLAGLDLQLQPLPRTHRLSATRRERLGPDAVVQAVRARWSVPGTTSAEHTLWLTISPTATGLRLAGITDGPGPGSAGAESLPVWWLEPVRIVRQDQVVVLAARSLAADDWLRELVEARAVVSRRLPATGGLVAELPGTASGFERVLGVRPGSHRLVAAAAWPFGEAVHLVVNPEAGGATRGEARQVLLVHEVVHVATGSVHGQGPLWLSEGYADLVALADHPAVAAAHEANLADDQRRHGIATGLVTDAELRPDNSRVHANYQRAWLTVRVLDRGPTDRPAPSGGVADRVQAAVLAGVPLGRALTDEGWTEASLAAAVTAELERLVR